LKRLNNFKEDVLKIGRLLFLTIFSALVFSASCRAHVGLDFPVGGETFEAGAVITIRWHILIDHGPCNWDLYFSSDGGINYQAIAIDLPKTQLTFEWTVPQIATQQGVIRVVQDNQNGTPYDDYSGVFTIEVPTGITGTESGLFSYKLFPAYPNPFNPSTNINYSIPAESHVSINIYDELGRLVTTLVNEVEEPGSYSVTWNGRNNNHEKIAAGIYIYSMKAGKYIETRKMILLK